ncbi:retrovirus-related pol polyprotein from transposon TNT 1-94 [Tanacetum coccineum]
MTVNSTQGVKFDYLKRYSKEPGPKVVFGDDSSRDTEGYGSVNCNGITFTRVAYVNGLKHNLISISQLCDANFKVLFTKTQGTIFNQNDEVVLISPRRRDVYIIDMSSFNKESNACFLGKASPRIKTVQLVTKGKHHKASFKTKRSFSINKSLHLHHMDLFGPVKPQTISHNKYTLVIVDEYSRNHKLEEFCDEKGISQNFSSPCTPKQNGVAERRNRTLIEAARTMVDGMDRNLIPSYGVMPIKGLVINEPESCIFFMNGNTYIGFQRESEFHLTPTTELIRLQRQIKVYSKIAKEMFSRMNYVIEARSDCSKAREIVKKNLEIPG